jgi:hypothetical protein
MNWLKQNFLGALIIAFVSVALSLGSNFIFKGCSASADSIKKAASVEYVDERNKIQDKRIDSHDIKLDDIQKEKVDKADFIRYEGKVDRILELMLAEKR